jgi:hypothetical protein
MAAFVSRTAHQHFVQPDAWAESHMPVSVPSFVHSTRLAPFPTVGQSGVLHAPATQLRSHLQAELQLTVSHASSPTQLMAHRDPLKQSMSLHALPPTQLIVQSQPAGQVTLPQLFALVHSTTQVCAFSSQDVQSAGQLDTTQ